MYDKNKDWRPTYYIYCSSNVNDKRWEMVVVFCTVCYQKKNLQHPLWLQDIENVLASK